MNRVNWTRRLMACVVCGLMAASVMAVPAKREWKTITQADGTTIEVKQMGDEFYHYMINREGQEIRLNENGMYEVAGAKPNADQFLARRAKSPRLAGQRRVAQNYGDLQITRILVLLVNFKDVKMQSKYNNSYYATMLNAETNSVRDYFRAASEGKYVPQFDVFGPYDLDENEYYYGHNVSNSDQHPDQMVVDACAKAHADGCDFSNYDTNNDNVVDNVYVIYAGYGENYNGSKEFWIWPHSWEIYSENVEGTLKYDGKTLGHYACSAELTGISGTNADGLGTFCHEFSHVIGLPDYYDADYEENGDNEGLTPGEWTLMDQGSYNGDGNYPALYSIYDKYFMGWKTPTILKDPDNIEMPVGGDYARQITSNDVLAKPTNTSTVYYLENRQKEGYDQGLPGHGMLVWQVKYSQKHWEDNDLNNYGGTLLYTIKSANSSSTDLSSSDTPFPGTNNVKKCTPITGHELTEISENAGVITFKYNGGKAKEKCTYELTGSNCTVPANGELTTNSALSLTITPGTGYTLADASCWDVSMGAKALVYGTDFTYNASTNEFRIEKVTDDVVIKATGKTSFEISWFVKGTEIAKTVSAGTIVLPASDPAGCGDGKVFVGWCKIADYESETTAPAFVKTGDAAVAGDKFYAVFAATSGGGTSWENASSIAVGDEVVLVYESSKMEMTSFFTGTSYYGAGSAYTTTPTGNFSFNVVAGKSTGTFAFERNGKYWAWTSGNSLIASDELTNNSSWNVTFSSGNAVIKNASDNDRSLQWNAGSPRFACYTSVQKPVQLYKKTGGTSYSDYTTTCAACDKKMTIAKGTASNGSFALDKEGEIETCGAAVVVKVKDIVPADGYRFKEITVSGATGTIDQENKTVTFAKNTTGTATINVTFAEKSSYTISFYNNGSKIDEQTVKDGEKATAPSISAPCSSYTFAGWWTEALAADNTTAQTWIIDFTATKDQAYYAVFSHSTESAGGDDAYVEFKKANSDGSSDLSSQAGGILGQVDSSEGIELYTGDKVYKGIEGLKLGSGGGTGWLSINLNKAVTTNTITVVAKQYKTDSGKLKVTVDDETFGESLSPSNGTLVFTAASAMTFETVKVETTSARAYVKSIHVGGGAGTITYYTSTVNCSGGSSLETIVEQSKATKIIRDGQLYILYNDTMYNIQGQIVK